MDRLMDGWMDGMMDGWMDGWISEWMDGWMSVWVDEKTIILRFMPMFFTPLFVYTFVRK